MNDPVCIYCGVPSTVQFCSDECEQLSEWERPGSTDVGPVRTTDIEMEEP